MTALEKAEELVDKMHLKQRPSLRLSAMEINLNDTFFNAKECALIAVDEITKTLKDNDLYIGGETNIDEIIRFWQEVKQEIENL